MHFTSENKELPLLFGSCACCNTCSSWIWRSWLASRAFYRLEKKQLKFFWFISQDLPCFLKSTFISYVCLVEECLLTCLQSIVAGHRLFLSLFLLFSDSLQLPLEGGVGQMQLLFFVSSLLKLLFQSFLHTTVSHQHLKTLTATQISSLKENFTIADSMSIFCTCSSRISEDIVSCARSVRTRSSSVLLSSASDCWSSLCFICFSASWASSRSAFIFST